MRANANILSRGGGDLGRRTAELWRKPTIRNGKVTAWLRLPRDY
jgi:hypothetical protein